jgi:hypothetical protein
VAIAQGFAYPTAPTALTTRVKPGLDQKLKIALMRGTRMVSIHAVFHQQLPVGAHTIRLRARDDLHAGLGLVADEIEILPGTGQVVHQAFNERIETDENKIPVEFNARRAGEPEFLAVKGGAIGVLPRHAYEFAVIVKGPGVIEALKGFRVATALPADLRPAVRTGVEQDADYAIAAAHQDDRAPRHASRSKIPWLRDFRGVASIEPALLEHVPLFERHDLRIREHAAMHTKHSILAVIEHQVVERRLVHGELLVCAGCAMSPGVAD